jgi:hypothetical protein
MTRRVEQSCNFSNKVTRTTLDSTHTFKLHKIRKLFVSQTPSRANCTPSSGNAGECEAVRKNDSIRHRYPVDWRRQPMLGMYIPHHVRLCWTIESDDANYKRLRRIEDSECIDWNFEMGMGGQSRNNLHVSDTKLILRSRW